MSKKKKTEQSVSLDLFCGLVAIFIVLILDSMVAVKHHDSIVRRLKIKHAELQAQALSLSKEVDKQKQGLRASVKGLKRQYESLKRRGQTVMRLRSSIANCKNWDSTGLGVADLKNFIGQWHKVLVQVDSSGHRKGGWKYWCFPSGRDHPLSGLPGSGPPVIPNSLDAELIRLLNRNTLLKMNGNSSL